MSFTLRMSLCLLASSLSLISPILPQTQPASSTPAAQHSSDDVALRALAESFYGAWATKDLDSFLRLWSAQSPDLEARRKETQELFARSERIELRGLTIRAVRVEGGQARVRVEVDALVIGAGTGKAEAGYAQVESTRDVG